MVTGRLRTTRVGQRWLGGPRETRNTYVSVISAYAPTARAPLGIMTKFMEDLQDAVDKTPVSDVLLLLGDFSSHVGCSAAGDALWKGVRGRHGIGTCNEAGERLLEFCVVNQLTIMNTWFAKKAIHLATWKHPATKQLHMIDYA